MSDKGIGKAGFSSGWSSKEKNSRREDREGNTFPIDEE